MTSKPMWNVFDARCPTRMALDRVADKWTVLIVARLAERTMRFGELRREIIGISQKMLTHTLRGLERDGLVARQVYPDVPPRVEYSLTPLGATLVGILTHIKAWAEGNIEAVLHAQRVYDEAQQRPAEPSAQRGKVVRLTSRAA